MKKLLAVLLVLMCMPVTAMAIVLPVMEGVEAPDFEVELINGEMFKLSDQRGKVVLINIWATWCGPCVSEMPDIDRLAKDYADDLVVIGVNCGEPEQTIIDFVEKNGYSYLFAADTDYMISGMLYPTNSIPYTIVVDPNGVVSTLHHGGGAGMYDVLKGYVDEAMRSVKIVGGYEILA